MIPSVTSDAIRSAMARFDSELRDTTAWSNWQADRRHHYAIAAGERLYPVKQIVSMAANVPVGSFGGGTEANGYVESRGFKITSVLLPTESEVRIALHELLLSRFPNPVPVSEAYQLLAETFRLPPAIRNASMSNGENHWENRVRFARRKLVAAGLLDGSDRGLYKLAVRSEPVVWLEKTLVEGRPDRKEGDYALGKALWSPQRDRSDGDTYALMREVQPGDIVLHLIDNNRIAGTSIADSYASMDFVGVPNTEWAGTKSYFVKLKNFKPCEPPFDRKEFLSNTEIAPQLRSIRTEYRNLFYDRDLNLNQGFYLTTVPAELANLLNQTYRKLTGKSIPHLDGVITTAAAAVSPSQPPSQGFREESESQQVWVYAPGRDAEHWDEFYSEGVMAIGWDDLGDLGGFHDLEEIKEQLKELNESDHDPMNDALACFEFAQAVRPGDLVFAKRGRNRIIGYGIVLGDYSFDPERSTYANVRRIRWDARGDWPVDKMLPTKALTNITDDKERVESLKKLVGLIAAEDAPKAAPLKEREPYTLQNALDGLFMPPEEFRDILRVWQAKKNLILQGPPGVGKTHIARRLAYALMGFKDPSRVTMVQFHQSYSYEDFVQGYRPTPTGGLQLRDGLFMDFCARAARDQDTPYIFIIDEINRGNLSRIFGELMMLIEADKRGSNWSVPLTYACNQEERFSISKNVFLLGLMNTADRSLAMVDYALRRRFAFRTLEPKIETPAFQAMLEAKGLEPRHVGLLVATLNDINEAIAKDGANLGPGYRIGHSFFCQDIPNGTSPIDWLTDVLETELIPLIEEYWMDDPVKASGMTDQLRKCLE